MSRVFVDSSVWIDHLRGRSTAQTMIFRRLLQALRDERVEEEPASLIMGDLILMEVLRGIADDRAHDRTRAVLLSFPQVCLGGTELALAAAEHFRALRGRGITVRKSVDCLIATWCIAHDVPLLHSDRDFEPFVAYAGLRAFRPEVNQGI